VYSDTKGQGFGETCCLLLLGDISEPSTQISVNLKQINTKKEFGRMFSTTAVQISNNSKLMKLRVLSRLFVYDLFNEAANSPHYTALKF
jgi:hypothetical protein